MPTHSPFRTRYPSSPLLYHLDARVLDDVLLLRGVERIHNVQTQQQAHDRIVDHVAVNHPACIAFVGVCMARLIDAISRDDKIAATSARLALYASLEDGPLDDMVTYAAAMAGAPGAVRAVRAMYARLDVELTEWLDIYGPHASRILAVARWLKRITERRDHARQMMLEIDLRGTVIACGISRALHTAI